MDIINLITRAIQSDKVSHAYIINGSQDEARALANYMAKGVNCLSGAGKPCETCSSCRKINNLNHPDVSITHTEGASIGIDQIRQLQKEVFIKPYEGRKRVNIICQGEKMTVQAQNCLLKVLEDPPGTGIIIICTVNLDFLLPTIVSRCQILKLDGGSPIINNELYRETFLCFMEEGFTRASAMIDLLVRDTEKSVEDFLDYMLVQLRDILVLKVAQNKDLLYIRDNEEFAQRTAAGLTLGKLDRLVNAVSKAREDLRLNVNAQLAVEVLLLEIQEV